MVEMVKILMLHLEETNYTCLPVVCLPFQAAYFTNYGNGARLSDSNAYLKPLRQAHASLRAFGEGREHLHHGLLHVVAAPPFPRRLPLGRVALLAPCCRAAEHSAQQRG